MTTGQLLIDDDCGFCQRVAGLVGVFGVRSSVATLQSTDLVALGVDPVRARQEMPYIHPDGRVDYGHRAWAAALATGPWPVRVLARVLRWRPVEPLAAGFYRWVATHRHRLPGGTSTCAR